MAKKNKTRYAILSILSKKPMSGYDIRKLLTNIALFYWSENNAQIYPMLKQLESEGLLHSAIDEKSGARQRRLYHITNLGLQTLREWLTTPFKLDNERNELLLKIASGNQTDNATLIEHLQEYGDIIQQHKKLLQEKLHHIETNHKNRPEQPYLLLTYDYVKRKLQAQQEWQQASLASLQTM